VTLLRSTPGVPGVTSTVNGNDKASVVPEPKQDADAAAYDAVQQLLKGKTGKTPG